MTGIFRLGLCFALSLDLGLPARAQCDDAKEQLQFLLSGMRHERGKLQSGVCRMSGRIVLRSAKEPEPVFDGPLTIFAAFAAERKIRFDRTQPGSVFDPTSTQPH